MTYNGKSENLDLLLSHCRYFDKSFTEMFLEYSTKLINFVQTTEFDWLQIDGNQMDKFEKKYSKSSAQKP